MCPILSSPVHASHQKPLAACVASILALSAPAMSIAATNWVVANCDDAGPGSLRETIGAGTTLSGDSVDMTALSCIVTLTTGEITVPQNSLRIRGGGAEQLSIDASQLDHGYTGAADSRIFTHTGTGTLKIYSLSLVNGHSNHNGAAYPALGGCVYSNGSVSLYNSQVLACSASSQAAKAAGGAIYAKGGVTAKYTLISGSSASGTRAYGGGVRALGSFLGRYATIDNNSVWSSLVDENDVDTWKYAIGGGVSARTNVTLLRSTISNNTANGSFAGIDNQSIVSSSTNSMRVYSSTISGNHADRVVGGVYSDAGTVEFFNSTIAFNTAGDMNVGSMTSEFLGPGLALSSLLNNVSVTLQSTLLSDNTYGSSNEFDLTTAFDSSDQLENHVEFNVSPANNFIRTSLHANPLPDDTIKLGSCAHLGLLRDNGGLTKTHALMSNSPAIDQGNNSLYDPMDTSTLWVQDQRGLLEDLPPYLYPRESNGTADIGAFEINQDDTVYVANFEGCTILI